MLSRNQCVAVQTPLIKHFYYIYGELHKLQDILTEKTYKLFMLLNDTCRGFITSFRLLQKNQVLSNRAQRLVPQNTG